jgi:hypothetical protein
MFEHDVTNLGVAQQKAEGATNGFLSRLIARVTGPMPVISGPVQATREGRPFQKAVGDDPVLLEKTKHVRNKKETMMQFYSRVGLGAAQIRTMSKEEIAHFVEVVAANPEFQERAAEALSFEPKLQPTRFNLDERSPHFLLT